MELVIPLNISRSYYDEYKATKATEFILPKDILYTYLAQFIKVLTFNLHTDPIVHFREDQLVITTRPTAVEKNGKYVLEYVSSYDRELFLTQREIADILKTQYGADVPPPHLCPYADLTSITQYSEFFDTVVLHPNSKFGNIYISLCNVEKISDVNRLYIYLKYINIEICKRGQNSLGGKYTIKSLNKCKYIVLLTNSNDDTLGFCLADKDGKVGEIKQTCATMYETEEGEQINMGYGLLLRAVMHQQLYAEGCTSIVNSAANLKLAEYYVSLGYEYGKYNCDSLDPITNEHRASKLAGLPYQPPSGYETGDGYSMKFCGDPSMLYERAFNKVVSAMGVL